MSDTLLQSTLRELRTLLSRPRLWLVFALVVALFVLTGPFGTYERLAFPTRLGYWLVLHAATWACALASISFFDAALSTRTASRMIRMLVGAAVAALPVGLAITVINLALLMRPLNLAMISGNILIALPISIAFSLLTWLSLSAVEKSDAALEPGTGSAAAPTPPAPSAGNVAQALPASPAQADRPALLDRLPVAKRGSLIRLEVQDHYVLVVTTSGTELLLMRLGDAIAETGSDAGRQIHRSHWVSDAGVKSVIREGGKNPRLTVETADGQLLPVSRSHMQGVRTRWGDRMRS
ncbi:LytTR family DNA-binding domain-containing protein [Hoeflea sp. AS16]|uniref:LytTR family DNA-binding domain-containing protein n=1 Tax=Hoeflea sp. AS16 TaxID=3135779 RepID=UPI003173BBA7